MLRRVFWRYVYQSLASRYTFPEWTFMNYGYSETDGKQLALEPEDEKDRNLIALYARVAGPFKMDGRDVLEVGSGRGGGASFIVRYKRPRRMVGIDISENAIAFCRERHTADNLEFTQGDAESIPFPDISFDAVLNVESSHCYGSIETFFTEAARVLRPGGSFLYADFRPSNEVSTIESALQESGLKIEEHEDITENVLSALKEDSATKARWIEDLADHSLEETLRIFAATSSTQLFEAFRSHELYYFRYHATK